MANYGLRLYRFLRKRQEEFVKKIEGQRVLTESYGAAERTMNS
jgi:hypothetical protein